MNKLHALWILSRTEKTKTLLGKTIHIGEPVLETRPDHVKNQTVIRSDDESCKLIISRESVDNMVIIQILTNNTKASNI